MTVLLQLLITAMWAANIVIHTRRLLRLAHVEQLQRWGDSRLRFGLSRIWWWLGQHSFWQQVQSDTLACVQLTLMLFLLAWGLGV